MYRLENPWDFQGVSGEDMKVEKRVLYNYTPLG